MKALLPLLAGSLLALSGCGFQPLHATGAGAAAFEQLDVSVGPGRDEADRAAGFRLRQHMLDRIKPSDTAPYTLSITPSVRQIGLGLTDQDRASRFDSQFTASWSLRDRKTGDLIERGTSTSKATFSADRDPYRLLSTDEAATERVTREIADAILADVALALADRPQP